MDSLGRHGCSVVAVLCDGGLNRLASIGTSSFVTCPTPAVLYKQFNRHERLMLSQNRSINASKFVDIRYIFLIPRYILPKYSAYVMTESFFSKKKDDIISRDKC